MNDIFILKQIFIKIQNELGLPDFQDWHNNTYTELSETIHERTGVLLSRNTLKNIIHRIQKKDKKYSPQLSTRNAIARYAGYSDWSECRKSFELTKTDQNTPNPNKRNTFYLFKTRKHIFGSVLAITIIAIAIVLIGSFINNIPVDKDFSISLSDTTGTAPHTITLKYDFSQLKKSNVKIDFDTYSAAGKYELKSFENKKGVENFCFYHPGYYNVMVLIDNKPVKRYNILINSQNWQAYAYKATNLRMQTPDSLKGHKYEWPLFYDFNNLVNDGFVFSDSMYFNKQKHLPDLELSKNYKTEYLLYKNFDIDGDNFEYTVQFNIPDFNKETFCYSAYFELFGRNSNIQYKIMSPGCKLYAKYRFSEVIVDGIQNNIENFEHDLSYNRTITLNNQQKNATISIDGQPILQASYQQPIGEIIGMRLTFKSDAIIQSIQLSDKNKNYSFFQ